MNDEQTNYEKYRGRCKELSQLACEEDPTLTLSKGWYDCPIWGMQEHWWCQRQDGTIHDPTKLQFPSGGIGEYIPFNGYFTCIECGNQVKSEDAYTVGRHVTCSYKCYGHAIGF